MCFVEEAIFEEDRIVIDDWHGECKIFAPVNGAIAKQLDNTTAIFYYMRKRTHFIYLLLLVYGFFLATKMMVSNGDDSLRSMETIYRQEEGKRKEGC